MSTTQAVTLVVLLVIAGGAAAVALARHHTRRRELRERFGPEYDRAVATAPGRRAAERELREREHRHATLPLHDLDEQQRRRYTEEWDRTQAHFVEEPEAATREADDLVTAVMAARGYPTGDFDHRAADLSVEHAAALGHYRAAHEVAVANDRGQASTEQLRRGLMHYRALFADLLNDQPRPVR